MKFLLLFCSLLAAGLILLLLSRGQGAGLPLKCPDCNVIIISADTLRPDHLGIYGYPRNTSENIDSFARKSFLFQKAYTTVSMTLPSLVSMHTGQYPVRTGVRLNLMPLDPKIPRMATILSATHSTAAFVSNFVLSANISGLDKGFSTYNSNFTAPELNRKDYLERAASETTEDVIDYISKKSSKSMFLWAHYIEPHGPYYPPPEYRGRFKSTQEKMVPLSNIPPYQVLPSVPLKEGKIDVNAYIDAYDDELFYLDKYVGKLLDYLEQNKFFENSLIIFVADHGEILDDENQMLQHGVSVYESESKIPLIIHLPEKFGLKSRNVNHLVAIQDIFATVLDFLNLENSTGIDSYSLLPLLRQDRPVRNYLVSERKQGRNTEAKYKALCTRTAERKAVTLSEDPAKRACFDISGTSINKSPLQCSSEEFAELFSLQEEYMRLPKVEADATNIKDLGEKAIKTLRSLGYVQ